MTFSPAMLLVGAVLLLIQFVAALPWVALAFVKREEWQALVRNPLARSVLQRLGIGLAVLLATPVVFGLFVQSREGLEASGRLYGAVLQVQLLVDGFILGFALLLTVWPKGGAVALASFREGVRQSMFWLLTLLALAALAVSPLLPYFTFGEDHIMVKELGYDTIMLAAVLFGALAASLFISDEIEGRTAVTLMSKPVSRRQFLLGKFLGILLACLVLFGVLGTFFEGVQLFKHWWDRLDPVPPPTWVATTLNAWGVSGVPAAPAADLLRGVLGWVALTLDTLPGLVLSFSQVMVLVAIAVSLATRVPMVVNLTAVLVVYFLAHLTPVLAAIGNQARANDPGSAVSQLLAFMAQLFDTVLPDLDAFRINPVLLSDTPMPTGPFLRYLGSVTLYGGVYTLIVLLFGLILFEDRDLA
jgi:ABC-type transport system involved in multi-copper enzyme maturation permease subunit